MAVPERVFKPFKVMLLLLVEVPVAGRLCTAEAVGVCVAEADPESVPVAEALLEALHEAVVASDVTTTPRIRSRKSGLTIINGVRDGSRGLQYIIATVTLRPKGAPAAATAALRRCRRSAARRLGPCKRSGLPDSRRPCLKKEELFRVRRTHTDTLPCRGASLGGKLLYFSYPTLYLSSLLWLTATASGFGCGFWTPGCSAPRTHPIAIVHSDPRIPR